MSDNTMYITQEGLDKLKKELKELIEMKRPEVAKQIKDAREFGDISENAAYDAARQEQAFVEGRISELQEIIKNSEVEDLNDGSAKDTVRVGSTVAVHIEGDEEKFQIVGAPEADPLKRKISHESPLGSALLGSKVGDRVQVEAPVGRLTYEIIEVA